MYSRYIKISLIVVAVVLTTLMAYAAYNSTDSTACPCDCGCATSGVCNCGVDCPCSCGCATSGVCNCGAKAALGLNAGNRSLEKGACCSGCCGK
jgi:hypothetical protein